MPWGFGGGYREPAPRRLTWEELLAEDFAPTPRPTPFSRVQDLAPDDRRQAQTESLFAGLAQIGAGLSSGRWDRLDPGAVAAVQDQALQRANASQESEWAAENERAAGDFARRQKEQQAKALYGMYERVAEGESPTFQARAETAARAGSMAELEKLGAEKGPRARLRSLGDDPDQYTVEQLQERLALELEKVKQRELLAGKVEEARQEAQARAEVEEASRARQNEKGLLWQGRETPAEAAAKAEAVERVRARYAAQGGAGGVKGQLYKQGERIVFAEEPSAANPRGKITPLDGQIESVGNLDYFMLEGGVRMAQRKDHPEWGAFEVPQPREGDPGYEQNRRRVLGLGGGAAGSGGPPPNAAPEANHLLNQTVAGLQAGGNEREALQLLRQQAARFGGKVNGFTPEQILAKAKQRAGGGR